MKTRLNEPILKNIRGANWTTYLEPEVVLADVHLQGTTWFGFGSYMNEGMVRGYVEVGRYCSVGRGVTIGLGHHDHQLTSTSSFFDFSPAGKSSAFVQESPKRRTIIGNDVWIGDGVRIASGVRVGNGAVIATGAVVVKDVDPYEIVGGIPAKRIKMRFGANIARNLEATKWWTYDPVALRKNLPSSPLLAAERLKNPDGRFDLFPQCHAKYEYSAPQQERDTPRLQCMAIRRMAARARRRLRF